MENLYESDYQRWIQQQKELLAKRQFDQLDLDNLIEEVEDMGKHEPRSLESHLVILLLHLLKYQYQTYVINPSLYEPKEFKSWYESMDHARTEIEDLIAASPSLKSMVDLHIERAYPKARNQAVKQMNRYIQHDHLKLSANSYPEECPWSFDQIMVDDWLPES